MKTNSVLLMGLCLLFGVACHEITLVDPDPAAPGDTITITDLDNDIDLPAGRAHTIFEATDAGGVQVFQIFLSRVAAP